MHDTARPEQSASVVSVVALSALNLPFDKFSEFKCTIGGNIADLRRVGKSGSALSLANF
jgi:hypothetical protein